MHCDQQTHSLSRAWWLRAGVASIVFMAAVLASGQPATAQQQPVPLTLERMVELGLRDSYRVRRLQLDIERTRSLLRAEQAGLRSRVDLRMTVPQFEAISDYKWNSVLQRNELVSEDTRRWEAALSVRQPVILFGFPTDGYLSLNNRLYRYTQYGDDDARDIRYYNRYYIAYEQPLFQPNRMRNRLEEAELELERSELQYQDNVVGLLNDLAEDYFDLLEYSYETEIAATLLEDMEQAAEAARELAAADDARQIDTDQLQVAIANAREQSQQARSGYRLQAEEIKQRLRLPASDSITVEAEIAVQPVDIDVERAIELARTTAPRMRRLAISQRESEISLVETRARDAFRMNLELSYGRETQNPDFQNMWTEPSNSYTVNVNAYLPLWDWGQRSHRIQASMYSLERTVLEAEEALSEIETSVRNEVRNLDEYEQRALNMQSNLALARQNTASSMNRYRAGQIGLVDLLQTIQREADTAGNFLDAYIGYRETLLRIERLTHYDFQRDTRLLERFGIEPAEMRLQQP